jgi:hypothetical protein
MHNDYSIAVNPDGVITVIYDDAHSDLLDAGNAVVTRASYVEPDAGAWFADLAPVNGPKLGPFKLRSEALAAEVSFLNLQLF